MRARDRPYLYILVSWVETSGRIIFTECMNEWTTERLSEQHWLKFNVSQTQVKMTGKFFRRMIWLTRTFTLLNFIMSMQKQRRKAASNK